MIIKMKSSVYSFLEERGLLEEYLSNIVHSDYNKTKNERTIHDTSQGFYWDETQRGEAFWERLYKEFCCIQHPDSDFKIICKQ